jgi:hypothetical protein
MYRSLIVCFLLLFGTAASGHAAASLTVSDSGNSQFVVQGTGFEGVAGMDVIIQYDNTKLTNPRVVQGELVSSSLMVTNSEAGKVRFATIDPYPKTRSGTGAVATITFDQIGNSAGSVTPVSANLVDVKGKPIPVTISSSSNSPVVDQGLQNPAPGGTLVSGSTAPAGGSGTTNWLGGGVTLPSEGTAVAAKTQEEPSVSTSGNDQAKEKPAGAIKHEGAQQSDEPKATSGTKATRPASVLEKFRAFTGEKNADAYKALFAEGVQGVRQEPPIVLSDGITRVKVFIDLPASGKKAPNFLLTGAKVIWITRGEGTTWVVEALPKKGTYDASIKILQDGVVMQTPLTVAPPLPADFKIGAAGRLTDADFAMFLKERGTDKVPRFDLNGDGKRDYIDDYIFTANFLAQTVVNRTVAEKKSQK